MAIIYNTCETDGSSMAMLQTEYIAVLQCGGDYDSLHSNPNVRKVLNQQ